MKNIYIAAGLIAAGYIAYTLYQKKQSVDALTFDVVGVDLINMKISIEFSNIGNSDLVVTAVGNNIFVDNILIGDANKYGSFTIKKTAKTKVDFNVSLSATGGISYLSSLFKGIKTPTIKIDSTINANGILFTKTTNI